METITPISLKWPFCKIFVFVNLTHGTLVKPRPETNTIIWWRLFIWIFFENLDIYSHIASRDTLRPIYTRYDFVARNLLTTRLRHFLGHDCRKVLKHVWKSYNFLGVVQEVACDKIVSHVVETSVISNSVFEDNCHLDGDHTRQTTLYFTGTYCFYLDRSSYRAFCVLCRYHSDMKRCRMRHTVFTDVDTPTNLPMSGTVKVRATPFSSLSNKHRCEIYMFSCSPVV